MYRQLDDWDCDWVPFPEVSEALKVKYSLDGLRLRPFGLYAEDRDVNFNQPLRPHLETQILTCCTRTANHVAPDPDFFWNLEIGKRIESLFTIAALAEKSSLMIDLRCQHLDCQEAIEIEVSIQELADLQQQPIDSESREIWLGGERFHIRKPIAADQLEWLNQSFIGQNSAMRAMLQTLLPQKQNYTFDRVCPTPEDMEALSQLMEEIDPLVHFSLWVNCPFCGTQDVYVVDLGGLALQKLRQAQQQLLLTVHRLASHYHWNEQEIFALPPWRRKYYLTLIECEAKT